MKDHNAFLERTIRRALKLMTSAPQIPGTQAGTSAFDDLPQEPVLRVSRTDGPWARPADGFRLENQKGENLNMRPEAGLFHRQRY